MNILIKYYMSNHKRIKIKVWMPQDVVDHHMVCENTGSTHALSNHG